MKAALVRLAADGSAALAPPGTDAPVRRFATLRDALAAAGADVMLIVPGVAVRLLRLTLPPRNRAAFLRALPFAVEERVAGPAESLRVAAAPPERDGTVLVAAVDDALFDRWRRTATEAGARLTAVLAEPLCLPAAAGWIVLFDGGAASVRCDPLPGFGCDAAALPELLARRHRETAAGSGTPPTLHVHGDGPLPPGWPTVHHPCPEPAALLRQALSAPPRPDLLAALGTEAEARSSGRALAVALGALALAALGVGGAGWWETAALQERIRDTRLQTIDAYHAAVPHEPVVLDARRQMQAHLDRQRLRHAESRRFAALVLAMDAALAADPRMRVRAFALDGDRYRLEVEGAGPDLARRLEAALGEIGGAPVPVAAMAGGGGRLVLTLPR